MQNIKEYEPIFIEKTVRNSSYHWKANYRCVCGNIFEAFIHHVKSGNTKSCGCLRKIADNPRNTVHGMEGSPTYSSWHGIKSRCTNPNYVGWKRYGGRGITYDPKWETFEGFLEDMGEKPGKGWAIDRIDNDGNYCKENCRWVTMSENSRKSHKERKENSHGKQ